jgi:acyl carrier protein
MKKSDVYSFLQKQLGRSEAFSDSTNLMDFDDFDSMTIFALINYIQKELNTRLNINQLFLLNNANTIGDFINLFGPDKFED